MHTTSVPFDPEADSVAESVKQAILNSSQIVVICGAGISVAAGIPAFRGSNSISKADREHFHLQSLQQQPDEWCSFMAHLASKAISASPTTFHCWLKELQDQGRLLRVYTQNIDGLEMKAGLDTSPHLQDQATSSKGFQRCLAMHGSLQRLRCMVCSAVFLTEDHIGALSLGILPSCSACSTLSRMRQRQGKRLHPVPSIRPDIVLYGETFNPAGETIAKMANSDQRKVDLLLVVGTGIQIPGTVEIIRNFSAALQQKAVRKTNNPQAIFLNTEKVVKGGIVEKCFDVWVEEDCQNFAASMMQSNKVTTDIGYAQSDAERNALLRQDPRPLWRYY